uniref:Uncharacterized protein n=1 Tax=Lygus hesperus TaxID=30085 RepID=A0A0A9YG11_LYGHE
MTELNSEHYGVDKLPTAKQLTMARKELEKRAAIEGAHVEDGSLESVKGQEKQQHDNTRNSKPPLTTTMTKTGAPRQRGTKSASAAAATTTQTTATTTSSKAAAASKRFSNTKPTVTQKTGLSTSAVATNNFDAANKVKGLQKKASTASSTRASSHRSLPHGVEGKENVTNTHVDPMA